MKCEFSYCIYNNARDCILDEIHINAIGMCEACEIVSIPEEDLKKHKKEQLDRISEIWKNYDNLN